ncbi:hypothetical protein HF086_008377 [Spodoptera exigua]|uniref:GST N-terminal domain-containing protein n=1 Tax=Spodoptera exigua TaxID=7107 RepID=A0A922M3R6_SPOEX|nr:hypothetical protein HF086_008377 [Spodoptera exigua]
MAPILYKIDASPPANAVRILSDIIGLELEVRDVNFGVLEHKSPEHLKLNPMVYGGDKSESLYPSDVRTRALVDQCMFFNVGIFFIRLKVIVLPALFGDLDGPTEKHKADIDEAYGIVEAYLAKNKYVAADHLTIADLSVGATAISMHPLHKLDPANCKMAPLLYKSNTSPPANARNPMGTIPTLIDGDFIISESHATMKYLLSVYSGGELRESLYPSDVRTRALVDQCMFFNAGVFFLKLLGCILPAVFGDLDGPTEQHKLEIDAAYSVLEAYLKDHKFPLTAAWMSRLEEHPSFKKILLPGVKILDELANAAWQKNRK